MSTEDRSAFDKAVRDAYRAVVAQYGDDGCERKVAIDHVRETIAAAIDAGEVVVPVDLDDLVRRCVVTEDERDGRSADAALRALSHGEDSIGVDGDPALDLVVTLGSGKRKTLRHITRDDLLLMDRLRYENMRTVESGYQSWRHTYEPWLRALIAHRNVEDAYLGGHAPALDDLGESA